MSDLCPRKTTSCNNYIFKVAKPATSGDVTGLKIIIFTAIHMLPIPVIDLLIFYQIQSPATLLGTPLLILGRTLHNSATVTEITFFPPFCCFCF